MRPPHIGGGVHATWYWEKANPDGFNEAPAHRRGGTTWSRRHGNHRKTASMRPPHIGGGVRAEKVMQAYRQ